MSCGNRLVGRSGSWTERDRLAQRLDRDSMGRLADAVRQGDCLSDGDTWRAQRALERQGLSPLFDYRTEACRCGKGDDGDDA